MNSSSFDWPFAVSAILAAAVFWTCGNALLRRIAPAGAAALPATSILFGQMSLWFASYLILPANALIQAAFGAAPSIRFALWTGVLTITLKRLWRRPSATEALGHLNHPSIITALGGAAALIAVAGIYGRHLGALGLDTHQHIYWSQQILAAGHLPLVERGTSILALYPKAFHVLVALWSAAGLGDFVGPWVKLMPFLQAWLPCLAFAELCTQMGSRAEHGAARSRLVAFGLIAALLLYGFSISRMIFPEYDLNGTPRIASGAALFFPFLSLAAGVIFESVVLRRVAWLCLPATALLLLAINAVLVVQLIVVVVPLMVATRLFVGRGVENELSVVPLEAAAFGLLPVLAIALGDPWIVALWSKLPVLPGEAYLSLHGIVTPGDAAELGIISRDELVSEAIASPRVTGIAPIIALSFESLFAAGRIWLLELAWKFPIRGDVFGDSGRILLRLSILGMALLAIFAGPRGTTRWRSLPFRLFAGVTLATAIGGFAQIASWKFAEGLAPGRGYEFALLRDYLEAAPAQVGLVVQGIWLLSGFTWALCAIRLPRSRVVRSLPGIGFTCTLAAVAACLPTLLSGKVIGFDPARSFWSVVERQDLANLREIETHIDDWEGVIVPASAWEIGGEKWIIPQGATASVLPFATKRYFFNSRLGPGVQFNWRDLSQFCRATPAERAKFLQGHDIRWLLIKDGEASSEAFYRRFRICDRHLADLGAIHPPAHRAGDLHLFRLDYTALQEGR